VNSRRGFFAKAAGVVAGSVGLTQASQAYNLPDLPYAFEALEPYIDTPTMKIHHDKHHGKRISSDSLQALTKMALLIRLSTDLL
jgi:hypothetical protein